MKITQRECDQTIHRWQELCAELSYVLIESNQAYLYNADHFLLAHNFLS